MSKINYTFGVDYNSTLFGKAFIPTDTGVVAGNMETNPSKLLEMVGKPNRLDNYVWTSASGNTAYEFPSELGSSEYLIRAFFSQVMSMFGYAKFGLRFRFKVNGSPFHKGLLQASFCPGTELATATFADPERCMNQPSIRMNAAGTTEYVLDVPAVAVCQYFPTGLIFTDGGAANNWLLGSLVVAPLTPLEYASGSTTSVNVTIWFEFIDLQLAGPSMIHQGLMDAVMDPLAGAAKSLTSGAVDGFSSLIKDGAKFLVGNIPIIGSWLVPYMDKPPLRTEPLKICRTTGSSWVHGEGTSNASTLSVLPGLLRPPKYEEVGKIGTIIDYIKAPGLVYKTDILTTTTAGEQLFQLGVNPSLPYSIGSYTGSLGVQKVLGDTPLSYMGRMFQWWRGTIEYTLEVVMPATSTCTIALVWVPDMDQSGLVYTDVASQCNTWVIDCNGPTTTHFAVKFMSDTFFREVARSDVTSSNVTGYKYQYCNGSLSCYVINPLMTNVAAPSTATVRVYIMAGDDFEYAVPNGQMSNITDYNRGGADLFSVGPSVDVQRPTGSRLVPSQLAEHQGLTDAVPVSEEQVVPSAEPDHGAIPILSQDVVMEPVLGETHMLPSVLKRYQEINHIRPTLTAGSYYVVVLPVGPTMSCFVSNDTQPYYGQMSNYLYHFAMGYRYWRGSMNYRVTCGADVGNMFAKAYMVPMGESFQSGWFTPRPGYEYYFRDYTIGMENILSTAGSRDGFSQAALCGVHGMELISSLDCSTMDINVPFFIDTPLCKTSYGSASRVPGNPFPINLVEDPSCNLVLVFWTSSQVDRLADITISYAPGDDFVCTYPVCPPLLNMTTYLVGEEEPLSKGLKKQLKGHRSSAYFRLPLTLGRSKIGYQPKTGNWNSPSVEPPKSGSRPMRAVSFDSDTEIID